VMGCAGSTPEPPPNGAPEDWKEKTMAVFRLLDKNQAHTIALVPKKKAEMVFSEISVLGEDVLEKQKAIDDFEANQAVNIVHWVEIIKLKIIAKGWGAVNELLEAVTVAVGDSSKNQCDSTAKGIYKEMDKSWCEPANTGSIDMIAECEALGDDTDKKVKDLLVGLEKDKKISADEWAAHVATKVEPLGWPRAMKQLMALKARLDKVADTDDMTAGDRM